MTAPRITRSGTLTADGYKVEVCNDNDLSMYIVEQPHEAEAMRALDGQSVAVTIEPADATPEEAPHGSALDYLTELKGLLAGALDGFAISEQTERALRRCASLANSASLAILHERRK